MFEWLAMCDSFSGFLQELWNACCGIELAYLSMSSTLDRLLVLVLDELAQHRGISVHYRFRAGWLYQLVLRVRTFLRGVWGT